MDILPVHHATLGFMLQMIKQSVLAVNRGLIHQVDLLVILLASIVMQGMHALHLL